MAWIDLADNQIPTYTDLSTSGLTLKSGQSHVSSTQCPTKAQLNAKYSLSPSLLTSYADNQLVPKSNLASAGSARYIRYVSNSIRVFSYVITSGSQSQTFFIGGEFCGDFNKIGSANTITTTSITVTIQMGVSSSAAPDTYNWTFRILDNATKTTVFYSNSGTATATTSTGISIPLTITGLTPGFDYYYEGIAISTSCPT